MNPILYPLLAVAREGQVQLQAQGGRGADGAAPESSVLYWKNEDRQHKSQPLPSLTSVTELWLEA